MNVPKLRFKGFKGEWKKKKLREVADIIGGGTPKTTVPEYWDGEIDWYSPSEIGNQIYLNHSKRKITELGLQKSSARMLPVGTILFTSRAGIGNTAILAKEATTNQGFQSIVPNKNKLDTYFIYSRSHELKRYGEINGAGSTFIEVSGKQMEQMLISLPEIKEQQKIGLFFEKLDRKIQLQQEKIDLLQKQKKGFLQKMFPKAGESQPELRFDGFKGEWTRYKWSDTVDISNNMVNPKTKEHTNLWHIGPGNIESFTGRILDNVNTVKDDNLISGKFYFKPGDIIYGKINPQLAKYALVDFEGLASADTYILNAKGKLQQSYLYTLLQSEHFYKYSISVSRRTGIPKINREELNQYRYFAPCIEEQEIIGEFFKKIDEKIILQKQKIDVLKEQKRGFLQQMFV